MCLEQEFRDAAEALQGLLRDASMKEFLTEPPQVLRKSFTEAALYAVLKEHAPKAQGVIERANKHISRMCALEKAYRA
eukprot:2767380-Amphidinium_carterae.1